MKYVKSIDDFKKYSFEFFDSFLEEELSDLMVNSFLLDLGDREQLENQAVSAIKAKGISIQEVCDYGEVILQLSDYRDLLKKFVSLLLKSEQFIPLSHFLNRIFLQKIGNVSYRSLKQDYTYKERYFDRFVEIIMYCDIEKELYMPFFFAILNSSSDSPLYFYKEPLKEYLDSKLSNSKEENEINGFLDKLKTSTDGNAEYSLSKLIDDFTLGEMDNLALIKTALQRDPAFSLGIIENIMSQDKDREYKCVQLLLLLSSTKAIQSRLKEIYDTTTNKQIKALLVKELSSIVLASFNTEQEFLSFVDANVLSIQDRLYGIRLSRFYDAYNLSNVGINGKVMTFVLETFRNREATQQVEYFKDYFKFVDPYVMQSLCNIVYDISYQRKRLLSSKWAMRLISTFGSAKLLGIVFDNMEEWLKDISLIEPCQYFLDIMCSCAREEVLPYIKRLYDIAPTNKMKKFLDEKVSTFSMKKREDLEQVKDKIVDDLGFDRNGYKLVNLSHRQVLLRINPDCSITPLNVKSEKIARIRQQDDAEELRKLVKVLEKKVKEQRKRLYSAFVEFRNYDAQSFDECIVGNNLLNFLAQHLLWGRYKNDRLVEICTLMFDRLNHVAGNMISDEAVGEYSVAILQNMDASDMKEKLSHVVQPLFDQFALPFFESESLNLQSNSVDNLSGVFCNANLFVTRLEKIKFRVADCDENDTFGTLVKVNENLNLITAVEFDRLPMRNYDITTTLRQVRFYELNKNYKRGKRFVLNKSDALMLENINPHVLSNELGVILSATKM